MDSWRNLDLAPPSGDANSSALSKRGNGKTGTYTGSRLVDRYRPNANGVGVFHREQQLATRYGQAEAGGGAWVGERKTEWDVVKENHR